MTEATATHDEPLVVEDAYRDPSWRGVSATEIRWQRPRSDLEQVLSVQMWDEDGVRADWEMLRAPWWADVERQGNTLRVWVRHEGHHRGQIQLAIGGWADMRVSVRVQAHLLPTPPAAAKGMRQGVLGALVGMLSALFLAWVFIGPSGLLGGFSSGAQAVLNTLGGLAAVVGVGWLPGAAWGAFVGGKDVARQSGLGTLAGIPIGALVAFNLSVFLPNLGLDGLGAISYLVAVPVGGLVAGWVWSRVMYGGAWLTRRAMSAGAGAALVWVLGAGFVTLLLPAVGSAEPGQSLVWIGAMIGSALAAGFWGGFLGASLGRPTVERTPWEDLARRPESAVIDPVT